MSSKVFDILVKLGASDEMSKKIADAVQKSQASLSRFGANMGKMGDSFIGFGTSAGIAATAMALPLIKMAKDAEAGESAVARLTQVFKSMGDETGVAAKKANELADSLMYKIAVDADDIMAVQAKLATFENVIKNSSGSAEIFERATKAAFDLQAAGFGDGASNAVQLGKALNDPVKGMNALTRAGVSFNAQEQAKIKALVASGQQFEAQQMMLAAIEKQVGGVAEATADDSAKIMLAFGDISAEIGKGLLPVMKEIANFLVGTAVPAVKKFVAENGDLLRTLGRVAAGATALVGAVAAGSFIIGGTMKTISAFSTVLGGLGKVLSLVRTGMMMLNAAAMANPIVAATVAIGAASAAVAYYWEDFNGFLNRQPAFLRGVMKLFIAPIAIAGGTIRGIIQIFQGDWQKGLNTILEAVKSFNILAIMYDLFSGVFEFLGSLGGQFYDAGVGFIDQIIEGIKAQIGALKDTVAGMAQSVRDYLPFSPAKVGPLADLDRVKIAETVAMSINPKPLMDAMGGMAMAGVQAIAPAAAQGLPSLPSFLSPAPTPVPAGVPAPVGGGTNINFAPQITLQGGSPSVKEDLLNTLRGFAPDLVRLVNQEMERQNRRKF